MANIKEMINIKDISEIELDILDIAERLSMKKSLNINNIYREAIKKLNYSVEDINNSIYNLILKKIIVPEKRIVKTQVLANDKRDKIYKFILNNPGVHLREIRDKLNLQPHLTNLHLKVLKDFNYIYQKKYLKYQVFFASNFNNENEESILALKNDKAINILIQILKHDEINYNQLKDHFSETISPKMINYHLKPLIESNLITNFKKGDQQYYKINKNIFDKIEKYIAIKIGNEIEKPIIVKRAYDYVGGNIRFKVVVENKSDKSIIDILVKLDIKEQFAVEESLKKIAVLDPEESRGVDFMLTPLACGKSNVQGTVSYLDNEGHQYFNEIKPDLIQIKCPLVQPKILNLLDVLKMKDKFQISQMVIPYKGISQKIAFRIAKDQIASLDVSEIVGTGDEYSTIFSGEAKITRNSLLVDLNVIPDNININVYMGNLKEATGFLAYIKSLIRVAMDYSKQISTSVEMISSIIFNAFEFSLRLSELFDLCYKKESVENILLIIKELQIKSNSYFPELKLEEPIKNWFDQLEDTQEEEFYKRTYLNLQFNILSWMEDVIIYSDTNLKIYYDSPVIDIKTRDDIIKGILTIKENNNQRAHQYFIKILYTLMVIYKDSGLSIYNYNFIEKTMDSDPDLISGFLVAIQNFGSEFSKQETKMKKLSYEHFEIELIDGEFITAALITIGYPNQLTINSLKELVRRFESRFGADLKHFSGKVSSFNNSIDIFQDIFS